MKILIGIVLFLLTVQGTGFASQWLSIEGKRFAIHEASRLDNGTVAIRLAETISIQSGSNTFVILKKTDEYLRRIYPVVKKDLHDDKPFFTYERFLQSTYAYDVIINAKYDSIIYFTSASGTTINGYTVPGEIEVHVDPDNLAYVLNNERAIKNFNLLKLVNDRCFYFNKKKYHTPHINKKVKVTTDTIQGIVDDAPLKHYGCYWKNADSIDYYGMVFDKKGYLLSGKLSAGGIYGFKTEGVYFFSAFIKEDGIGKLYKIIKNEEVYFDTKTYQNKILKPLTWHGIGLEKDDQFFIIKPGNVTPEETDRITYKIILAKPARIDVFKNNKQYLVKNAIHFHGNSMPAYFTLAEDAMLAINGNTILMKAGTQLHFYKNGQFKSGIFIGSYKYTYAGQQLKLYSDIAFYKNKKLKEGILAEDATMNIWGKETIIPKDSVLRFSKNGKLETYTYVGDDNKIRIIFVPDIDK